MSMGVLRHMRKFKRNTTVWGVRRGHEQKNLHTSAYSPVLIHVWAEMGTCHTRRHTNHRAFDRWIDNGQIICQPAVPQKCIGIMSVYVYIYIYVSVYCGKVWKPTVHVVQTRKRHRRHAKGLQKAGTNRDLYFLVSRVAGNCGNQKTFCFHVKSTWYAKLTHLTLMCYLV